MAHLDVGQLDTI